MIGSIFELFSEELVDTEDVFENNEYVLIKSTVMRNSMLLEETSVGIKNDAGDIVKIVTVDVKPL